MRTNRARRPTASRRPPSPRARAERLPLDARIFGSRARLAPRIQPHHRPSRPRANATVARDRESRDAFSLFFHARHRAKSPSSRDAPFSSPPDDDRTIDPRAYRAKRTTADYRSIDRGETRRARIPRPRARGDGRVSLVPLAQRVRRSRPSPWRRALPRARGTVSDPRARVSARGADGDRPTDPTDRVCGHAWSWMGWIRSWVVIARSGGYTRYFRSVGRSVVIGRSCVVIGES